jgi:glutamine synthetase
LPLNVGQRSAQLGNNQVILEALGVNRSAYLAVRKAEWDTMQDFELEAEVKLLLERY